VFPLEKYGPFLDVLGEEAYRLCSLFGKVSQDRENAALAMIKIFESRGKGIDFINAVVKMEIAEACTNLPKKKKEEILTSPLQHSLIFKRKEFIHILVIKIY